MKNVRSCQELSSSLCNIKKQVIILAGSRRLNNNEPVTRDEIKNRHCKGN